MPRTRGPSPTLAQGHFVGFPFLKPAYAELRRLVTARERLAVLRRGAITQLRTLLELVFPEFEALFRQFPSRTSCAVLSAYPTPEELLGAPRRKVLKLLKIMSRGHLIEPMCDELLAAARTTLGLGHAGLRDDLLLTLERLQVFERQIAALEARMVERLKDVPETPFLLSVPKVAPVTAAVFLGSIGDPQAYESSRQVLKVAGLSLVERSSGILRGTKRVSKRGRPLLRAAAYMLAIRSVRKDGIFRAKYEAMIARNGGRKMPAVVALSRKALKLLFSVARARRRFTAEFPPLLRGPTR